MNAPATAPVSSIAASATLATLDTPDGPFTVLVDTDGAVLASGWTADADAVLGRLATTVRPASVALASGGSGVLVASAGAPIAAASPAEASGPARAALDAVRAFYDGDLEAPLRVPVRQYGTPLQRAGWEALRRIPAGAPLTYAEFAAALGRPSAVRFAASICARNAPALFVPCHRVLRTGGAMGGFAWGVEVKRALLAREAPTRP
ncbi:methylated-DNA--[protein]-cysteine S-methyltransferase [uncultured Microbacterium sp.]|uniref:methylated-DNA--[protein]-cysteine S-methyltransferase n=1 Tax=uncultured Microbacterium sp. TaxID=191216 RepID=UPI0025F53B9A|nr:methylated-DNA--[protein]-cysteine S-methyltransferase [uncultured Microbacterium sp.]